MSLVPSVVLFEGSETLVGDIARDQAAASPELVCECVKRHIGDRAWRFMAGDKEYSAVQISAFILQEIRRIAEEALGGSVTEAVVTVPAYFHDAERAGTIEAAELAGLKVLRIVNEPTAAAIYHGFSESSQGAAMSPSPFLVYDLGGGTFDITIMRQPAPGSLETVCTRGNHFLGGKNWDERLIDHVASAFTAAHSNDPRLDPSAQYDLGLRCERAKIALTERIRTQVVCQHAGRSVSVDITRGVFEQLTADLLSLTENEVDRAIKEVGLNSSDLSIALLVGGSSKMPMVRGVMERKAPAVRMSRDPDHCVALGAALEAARLSAGTGLYKPAARRYLKSSSVTDRTPHGLGTIAIEGNSLVNAIIIPKNTRIPCALSRSDFTTTYDNQASFSVHVVQGEDKDPQLCVPVATYEFIGIPPRPAGRTTLRVTFSYDENNVVDVGASDTGTGMELAKTTRPLVDLVALQRLVSEGGPVKTIHRRKVVLLIDASGSMSSRMDKAKDACHEFIKDTDFASTEVGLIQFGIDSSASIMHELSRDAASLLSKVDSLVSSGTTPMHEAFVLGLEMLAPKDDHVERFLVLFTDGQPDDRSLALRSSLEVRRRGISILCIGVGAADRDLLDEMASVPGQVEFSRSSEELVTSFGNVARLISGRSV
jgi:molecular chaperone DnaK (HSP70)